MGIPTLVYPAVALGFGVFGLAMYVFDLRAKGKKQALIINDQKKQVLQTNDEAGSNAVEVARETEKSVRETVESVHETEELDSEQKLFVRLCQYLYEKHPFTNPDLRIEDLTRELNTNRTTLGSCVRKYSPGNITTQQLVTRYRLRYAAKLLGDKHSELTVSQVSEASGFNSRSAFNRQFFLLFGCSPTDYREHSLNQTEGETPSNLENTLEK